MRVGIITIEQCNNYGAELQAYALQKKLQLMGYDAENINYYFYKHPLHKKTCGAKPIFALSVTNRVKEFLSPLIARLRALKSPRANAERTARFAAFAKANIKHSRGYQTVEDLCENPPQYDVYVTGSDQVWNPRAGATLDPYFLSFAPPDAKRISYAASFGVSSLSREEVQIISQRLKKYSAISVREKTGVELVSQMDGVCDATAVLDPTLLLNLEEWTSVATCMRPSDESYLLVYDLVPSPELWKLAIKIAASRNLKIYRLCAGCGLPQMPGVKSFETAGPSEFIDLFAHASFVVTNSFHGTAFSVNFSKPFFAVKPRGMKNASRIESLLDSLDLSQRFVSAEDVASVTDDAPIDFSSVQEKLSNLRAKSIQFLQSALKV